MNFKNLTPRGVWLRSIFLLHSTGYDELAGRRGKEIDTMMGNITFKVFSNFGPVGSIRVDQLGQ